MPKAVPWWTICRKLEEASYPVWDWNRKEFGPCSFVKGSGDASCCAVSLEMKFQKRIEASFA